MFLASDLSYTEQGPEGARIVAALESEDGGV